MKAKRKTDWANHLMSAVSIAQRTPFKWGEHDCALFAADVVLAITGTDFAVDFRGTYSTAKGSLKAIKKAGFNRLEDIVDSKLENVEIKQSIRGDVICVRTVNGPALGINMGHAAVAAGPKGIEQFKRNNWLKAWRV